MTRMVTIRQACPSDAGIVQDMHLTFVFHSFRRVGAYYVARYEYSLTQDGR